MTTRKPAKLTILEVVAKVLESDLPLSTRNEITRHYLLPKLGMIKAPVEDSQKVFVGTVERPDAEEIDLENNPEKKAGDKDFERLAGVEEDEDE